MNTPTTDGSGPDDPRRLRALAERLALGAGEIARRGRAEHATVGGDTKSSATDVVTRYDREAEEFVVDLLRRERPADAIIGEEGAADDGTSGYAWYIDPIDGTTNFVYNQPAWGCSIGVAHQTAGMVAGAVAVPALDELYSAHLGGGATCNGAPLQANTIDDLSLALVGTGFGYQAERRVAQAGVVTRLIGQVRDIRRLGAAAFDLCMVAGGRLDAYYELHLNAWDAAAGELIAREAGAISSDLAGGPASPAEMVVAAPGIHPALLAALVDAHRAAV